MEFFKNYDYLLFWSYTILTLLILELNSDVRCDSTVFSLLFRHAEKLDIL